jgi:signal transduction histidine kinase
LRPVKRLISQWRWPNAIGRAFRNSDDGEQSESESGTRTRHDRAFICLSRCALRTRDGASVLGDICRITARALRVDHVLIGELLPDGRTLIARAASGWVPERLALWQFDLAPESRLGQAVRNGALIVVDGGTEPGGLSGGNDLLRDLHMRSGLVTGVSAEAGSYALFGVYSIEPRRFTREELRFVRGVGHIVESTLERCVRAATEKAARVTAHAEQADLLRIVVGRLAPALRESIGQLSRFRTSPTDTFTFRRAVRQTERQVAAITEFIEDLQLLSELLDGRHPGNEAVLLAPLLASIVEQLGDRAQQNQLTLQLRMADQLIGSRGDASLIRRAIFNIVDNALRFTGAGGCVIVNVASADASTVIINVADNGRGMTAAQLDRLMQKREGSLRSEHRGAGLGWRLAAAIVEAHGGSLTPGSAGPDRGATVHIRLPRVTLSDSGIPEI